MHAPQTIKTRPPVQPDSQADSAMHHPAHHRDQGKDTSLTNRRAAKKGHSMHSKEAANATTTPHILPYIGRGMAETTNPKHTQPTRNHPADKQTPPQHKAERPDATAKPSDARPAIRNMEARAARNRTTTPTPRHAKQRSTVCSNEHPKRNPCTKPQCKCAPTSPPKTKPNAKVHRREKKTHSIQIPPPGLKTCLDPCLPGSSTARKTHMRSRKRQRAHRAKPNHQRSKKTSPPGDSAPASPPAKHVTPTTPLPETENRDRSGMDLDKERRIQPEPIRS
ncbi:hypothetical protein CRENBAI_010567 [Crenichthys baileyi]|uniref:Uncharacterized protein n=1 Tax=Crenichthys baileyi TaxID=28760 RepID=A0AAV9SDC2_9TELE